MLFNSWHGMYIHEMLSLADQHPELNLFYFTLYETNFKLKPRS
jgi:hypothetical protein